MGLFIVCISIIPSLPSTPKGIDLIIFNFKNNDTLDINK